MGIYPNVELTYHTLKDQSNLLRMEINQIEPRLIKNNLLFYSISQIKAGPFNSALVSQQGEVLLQGMNDFG